MYVSHVLMYGCIHHEHVTRMRSGAQPKPSFPNLVFCRVPMAYRHTLNMSECDTCSISSNSSCQPFSCEHIVEQSYVYVIDIPSRTAQRQNTKRSQRVTAEQDMYRSYLCTDARLNVQLPICHFNDMRRLDIPKYHCNDTEAHACIWQYV